MSAPCAIGQIRLVIGLGPIATCLNCLVVKAKDVVAHEQCTLRIARARDIGLHAIDCCVAALGLVALGLDWGDGTAGV